MRVITKGLFLAVLLGLTTSCTKSPKQYESGTPATPSSVDTSRAPEFPYVPTKPNGGIDIDIEKKYERTQKEIDQLVEQNSLQPIVYGESAAGVTLDTTFEESMDMLSPPSYGPAKNGRTDYKEQVIIYWRADKPRVPEAILITTGYLGELKLPAPYGNLKMGDSVAEYFPESDLEGTKFLKDLYNHFENKAEDFNCLTLKSCRVNTSHPDYLILEMPKLQILVAKNGRTLFRMVLQKDFKAGKLANDFDLLNGKFLVTDNEGVLTGETIDLGISWKDLKEQSGADSYTETFPSMFIKRVKGTAIVVNRTEGGRSYLEPRDEELFQEVALYTQYSGKIRLGDKFIQVNKGFGNTVYLKLSSAPLEATIPVSISTQNPVEAASEETKFYNGNPVDLQVGMSFLKAKPLIQKDLIQKLSQLFETELKKQVAQSGRPNDFIVTTQLSGLNDIQVDRKFSFTTVLFDKVNGTERTIFAKITEGSGQMVFSAQKLKHPMAKITLSHMNQNWVVGSTSLMGFNLNQEVSLTDTDFARSEAKAHINGLESMVRWTKDQSSSAFFEEDGNLEKKVFLHDTIGSLPDAPFGSLPGVTLKTKLVSESNGEKQLKVVSISSTSVSGEIENICGLSNFKTKIGVRTDEFVSTFKSALDSSGTSCVYHIPKNPHNNGVITAIFLPSQNLVLKFSANQLAEVEIYLNKAALLAGPEPTSSNLNEGGQ